MSINPKTSISDLPGVGPKTLLEFEKINVKTYLDLLMHLPNRYQDRSTIKPINDWAFGTEALIDGQVISAKVKFRGRRNLEVLVEDLSGEILLRFFFFSKQQQLRFEPGAYIRLFGTINTWGKRKMLIHPEYTLFAQAPAAPEQFLTPVYPATKALNQNKLRRFTEVLTKVDWPKTSGVPFKKLCLLHSPPAHMTLQDITQTQDQIALDELTAHYLVIQHRLKGRLAQKAKPLPRSVGLGKKLLNNLGFRLTRAQAKVAKEILLDLENPWPMLRLLQGDVGSGKTIIAAFSAIRAAEQGYQTALLAPTELLAEQHYHNFLNWLHPLKISVCLITGQMNSKELYKKLTGIKKGCWQLVIGTHAIFQEKVEFKNLVLTIIDEQHRFGVHQRMALLEKTEFGLNPHQLILTATPIPRTLTMALYGDMDLSIIDELPKGRKPIQTLVMTKKDRTSVIHKIAKSIISGQQVYWVCTIIEDSDMIDAQSAKSLHQEIKSKLPGKRIALLHGQLKSDEKLRIMALFKAHEIDLLIATTIIEVGVDVPNATLMIVENAERLGLAQLHQLRGRIGRSDLSSTCILINGGLPNSTSSRRLQVLSKSQDGFYLAEQDLLIRGPGDLLGTRQSGEESFRLADLSIHNHLMPTAIARGNTLINSNDKTSKLELKNLLATWADRESNLLCV